MSFRLVPNSVTLDDLERMYYVGQYLFTVSESLVCVLSTETLGVNS